MTSTDRLSGLSGDDTLDGGTGAYTFFDGTGADILDVNSVRDSLPGARDTSEDFVWSVDHIDLHSIDANIGATGDQAVPFIGAMSFTG
ncbi:hypothetical protein DC522_00025 [Microvirga sp. KLBC 81]|uniref:M10 family metallopeptidase C-terminal domain-containing protein n=1 Tax=Microvirga sp. KLBC 81 TaxID=1862707 RepID=UPI000D509264|nr:hypothetical protein DC522_00025 [Microvirga sp. KLBC 81]